MGNPQRVWAVMAAVLILLIFSAPLIAGVPAPNWDKTFVPDTIGPGSVSILEFDITNDYSIPAEDLAFADNLPAGVTIAIPASASSSCGGGILSAPDGGGSISLSGGSVGGNGTCSVQVNVTSSTPGTHTNVSGDLTSTVGNSGTATDDLTVATDRPGFSKSFDPASIDAGERSTLTFTIDNSGNTNLAFNLSFTDNLPAPMVVASPPNASMDCPVGQLTANPGSSVVSYSTINSIESLAAGATCTISLDVTAVYSGVLENVSGDLTSSVQFQTRNSGKAAASLDVSVGTVHLTKEFIDDPVSPGGTVTLEFSIFNRSRGESATSIAFTDDLDLTLSGLVAVDLPALNVCGDGSQLSGSDTLTLTGGNLAAGDSCTFSVALQVPTEATPGGYHNETSIVTGDVGGVPTDGNTASDTLFVGLAPVLTKEFTDDPVAAGDSVTLEFTITNTSTTSALSDIHFDDELTTFLPFPVSATLPANGFCGAGSVMQLISFGTDRQGLGVTGGALVPSGSCTFSVTIDIPKGMNGGIFTNTTSEITALLNSNESTVTGGSATDDLVIAAAPRLVKEFIDDPVEAGSTATLRFLISHQLEAPADALAIAFSDDLESTGITGLVATGLPSADVCGTGSLLSGTDTISLTGGTLAPGESCTIDVSVQVPAGVSPGSYTNTADPLTATVAGLETTGPGATADLLIGGLALTKEFTDDPVIPGDTVTLEFSLTNVTTDVAATDITFTDNLGSTLSGLVATGLPANGFCGAGSSLTGTSNLTFADGTLAAGQSCIFSATLQVPAAAENGSYVNRTSQVTATMGGSTVVLPSARDILDVSDELLNFSKSFDQDSVAPGSTIDLTFNITNPSGSHTITGISFTDDLDAALSGLAATVLPADGSCGAGSSLTGTGILTFTGGELNPLASCQFTVTLAVPPDAAYGSLASNTTSMITGLIGDLAVTGSVASDFFKIHSIELSKSFAAGDVYPGDTTTLSFTISNLSDQPIERIGFTDDLEAVLPGLMADGLPVADVCGPGTGSSITGSSVLTFTDTGMEAGDICQFDVSILVPGDAAPGSYLNVTSIVTAEGGLPTGLPASASLAILERPQGTIIICHKPGTPAEKTKEIDIEFLDDHLGHGDYVGACEESPPATVIICHKPGTRAEMTKEIQFTALGGHLGHGDYLGECGEGQQKYRIK